MFNLDTFIIEVQMVTSSLGIIWLGAHGSLRRPPSAAPAKPKDGSGKPKDDEKFTEGLVASDAIMFPLLAGCVLVGLYYLIEYLQDPNLLNKILRAYLSVMSLASLSRLCADAFAILATVVFPTTWADRNGKIYRIDSAKRAQYLLGSDGEDTAPIEKASPLPGPLSRVGFSQTTNMFLWSVRRFFLLKEWAVRIAFFDETFRIRPTDVLGIAFAVAIAVAYHLTGWDMISNLLGAGFSYAAFSMMSPTSFSIGTLVLAGLFVYDIVMVFYTPYMITVASKIDAPIKLVFQSPKRKSMLGLGDIIIPGIFIALALRFDLYQFYHKKMKQVPTELVTEVEAPEDPGKVVSVVEIKDRTVKEPYVDPKGQWGDWLWTTSPRNLLSTPTATSALAAMAFPKTYFWSCMIGYAVGMLCTLTMLLVFQHGQPALLYLVPCVTGAAWLTGYLRGELPAMRTYTEDGSLDTEDVVVETVTPKKLHQS
ncbi:peptidase A22B, signal peptide peptidase [Thozetella sp. PMI_491]|nr:peptidase A22B, signal peptide peptidase [Thozetella sp. PMI_491]